MHTNTTTRTVLLTNSALTVVSRENVAFVFLAFSLSLSLFALFALYYPHQLVPPELEKNTFKKCKGGRAGDRVNASGKSNNQ